MRRALGLTLIWFSVCYAPSVYSQSLDEINVTLEFDSVSLETCFDAIESQTGFLFAFRPDQVDPIGGISVPKGMRSLRETLDIMLEDTPLAYRKINNSIVIFERQNMADDDKESSGEHILIRGEVTGFAGEPLSDVNVLVKRNGIGTTTRDGHYSILAKGDDVLSFSHVGYKQAEVPVNNRQLIDLALQYQIPMLPPVEVNAGVNNGCWKEKESERTGNIAGIDAREIGKQPVSNPALALQGRLPGIYVQQLTGVPGGAVSIQVRGADKPMIVIDGVPYISGTLSSNIISGKIIPDANPLTHINPADIESIEILKDADATVSYGARGTNGVMLITTKRGRKGKTGIDVNFYQGIGNVTRTMDLLNTSQYVEMRKEAFQNDGVEMTADNAPDLLLWDTTRHTDWQKTLIGGTASITNAHASLSGGDDKAQYRISSTYYRESTTFPSDFAFQRGSAQFHFNHIHPNKKLRFALSSIYSFTHNHLPKSDLMPKAIELLPNAPDIYNEHGQLNWENSTWLNPFGLLKQDYTGKTSNGICNAVLDYQLLSGLYLRGNFGYHNMKLTEVQKNPISSFDPARDEAGYTYFGNGSVNTWIIEPQVEYFRSAADGGNFQFMAGTALQQTMHQSEAVQASRYVNVGWLESLFASPVIQVMERNQKKYRYGAALGRINYSHKDKYIINLSARRDRLNGGHFANNGAVGTAWIFSEEPFVKWSPLSFGKLRMSYGITDGYSKDAYYDRNSFDHDLAPFYGRSRKAEAAIEVGLFENRYFFSASYYRNASYEFVRHPSRLIGDESSQYHSPVDVTRSGLELILSSTNVASDHCTWRTFINLTIPKNKMVGQTDPSQKRYHFTGIEPQAGVYTFQANGRGKPRQDFYGGIQNSIQLGNLQLDILVQVVKQAGENYLAVFPHAPGTRFSNQPALVMDRWQQPGDITTIQRFTQGGDVFLGYTNAIHSNLAISDASFIRLKNISLSWNLKTGWLEKMKMWQCRVYVQGQNLLTLTKYAGYDPESQASRALPPLKVVTGGVELKF